MSDSPDIAGSADADTGTDAGADAGAGAGATAASAGHETRHPAHEEWKREQDERSWAMLCHVAVLGAAVVPFGHIVGPLVVWLAKRSEYPLVDDQGRESLNYQISMTIYSTVLVIVFIVGLIDMLAGEVSHDGFPTTMLLSVAALLLLGLVNLVLLIIASVRSYRGERYRYPLAIRFLSE